MKSFYQLVCLATVVVALLGHTSDVSAVSIPVQTEEAALFKRDSKKGKKNIKNSKKSKGNASSKSKGDNGNKSGGSDQKTKKYTCYLSADKSVQGQVDIWWGFSGGDASWACNNWKSGCGNGGGCYAKKV